MEESIIMLVVVGILIIVVAVIFIKMKKKEKQANINRSNNSSTGGKTGKKSSESISRKDMSDFIKFDKIANDMIYQKKGEKYTMAIQCKGINYDLMSEIEQMSVEEGFIKFLNTLRSPIQLYVQSRSVNLSDNIKKYKERTDSFNERYSEMIARYNDAEEDIDVPKEEVEQLRMEKLKYGNIAEYAGDITRYIEKMSLNKFMLQRNYYILISYYKSEIITTEKFSKEEYEELCYRELYTRAQGIISSLASCSIKGRTLNSNELAELIFVSYNRDDQRTMDIKRALESGFYRMYTTSADVRLRKQQILDEQIREEAARRVEQAIQEGIENGTLISPEQAAMELDKTIDKESIKIVNESELNPELKEKLKNNLIEKRREKLTKKRATEVVEEQIENEVQNEEVSEKQAEEIKNGEEKINELVLDDEFLVNGNENEKENKNEITKRDEVKNEEPQNVVYPSMNDEITMREQMTTISDELENEKVSNNKPEEENYGVSDEDDSIV